MWLRLKIEWMKMRHYPGFLVLGLLYLITIGGVNYLVFRIQQTILSEKKIKNMAEMVLGQPPYSFPTVWQMTAYVSSFLLFIPGLLIIMSVTNEYTYKTHRQNVIDGWTRRDFISSKILMAIVLSLVSTLMVTLAAAIFGFAEGSNEFSLERFYYIGYYLLQSLSYMMVALLIAVLVKRGVFAIGIYFLYSFFIENILSVVLNKYFSPAGQYLPLQSTDELIPVPLLDRLKAQLMTPPDFTILLIVSLVYLAAYFVLTFWKFQRDDL